MRLGALRPNVINISRRSTFTIEIDRMRLGALRLFGRAGVHVLAGAGIEIDRMRLGALRLQDLNSEYRQVDFIEIDRMRLGALRPNFNPRSSSLNTKLK